MDVSTFPSSSFVGDAMDEYTPKVKVQDSKRLFLSAQRRYDNMRVRESEIQHRVCFDCGRIVHGDDLAFQHHMVSHEAAFICYQLYHFEKGTTMPRYFNGRGNAKLTKQRQMSPTKKSSSSSQPKTKRIQADEPAPKKCTPRLTRRGQPIKKRGRKPRANEPSFINDRRISQVPALTTTLRSAVKRETSRHSSMSEDSDVTHVTDDSSGHISDQSFKSEPDIEIPIDDSEDYDPRFAARGMSSRGRTRKPKNLA